tara:strand:+ start:438 stop:1184 length:747 start_codon:yes stop_codon:yes gene_type:complete
MKITYNDQTIDFFEFNPVPEKIILSLSGGLDSASICYLLHLYFPSIEIIPFCGRDVNAPLDHIAVKKIINWMKEEFPNSNLKELVSFDFDDRDESFYPACRNEIAKNPKFSKLDECQVSKILQLDKITKELFTMHPGLIKCDGMTANPPVKVMKTNENFYKRAERRRDPVSYNIPQMQRNRYSPYINVDKKFVADIYKKHNLMDSLYPLCRSCTGREDVTNNYTEECHRCFWCYEKKWAFDLNWNKDE